MATTERINGTPLDLLARAEQVRAYSALVDLMKRPRLERQPYEPVVPNNTLPRLPYKEVERSRQQAPSNSFEGRPPRVTIINSDTGEELACQYNPEQLSRQLDISYNIIQADGLGYTPLQFQNTNAQSINISLDLSAMEEGASADDMIEELKFIESLCYPHLTSGALYGSSPPVVLFVWPNYIVLQCVVTSWKEDTSQFDRRTLKPRRARVELTLKEARFVELYSSTVRLKGGQR